MKYISNNNSTGLAYGKMWLDSINTVDLNFAKSV